jgi:hypothetical protein
MSRYSTPTTPQRTHGRRGPSRLLAGALATTALIAGLLGLAAPAGADVHGAQADPAVIADTTAGTDPAATTTAGTRRP